MLPSANLRFNARAFAFERRGEKKRSSAFHRIQIDLTTEFALWFTTM